MSARTPSAMWSGIMKVAQRGGLCEKISVVLAPVTDKELHSLVKVS